jgi:hypothetical protein
LDRGGAGASIGSAARGRLVRREKGNSETGWSQSRTMFSAALENRNTNKSNKTDYFRALGGRGIERVERMEHRRRDGERRKGEGVGEDMSREPES